MEEPLEPRMVEPLDGASPEPPEAADAAGATVAPFGSWVSPIRAEDLVADIVRLAEPWLDGDDVYWLEGRPSEGGRRVLVRRSSDGTTVDLTPAPYDVRTRVHEYGGGSYVVVRRRRRLLAQSSTAGSTAWTPATRRRSPVTPEGPYRYADLRFDPAPPAVRGGPRGPRRRGPARGRDRRRRPRRRRASRASWWSGPDFLAAPRLSPDGAILAWLEWDHPDMPWDATRLRTAPVTEDGSLGPSDLAAGGPEESIVQPEWSPDGVLHLVSDRSGWWNLYRLVGRPAPGAARPDGGRVRRPGLDLRPIVVRLPAPTDRSSAVARAGGHDRLIHVQPGHLVGEVESAFTELDGLRVGAERDRRRWRARRPSPRWSSSSTRRRSRRRASCAGR